VDKKQPRHFITNISGNQWHRKKGGQVGTHAPGRSIWGRISTVFAVI